VSVGVGVLVMVGVFEGVEVKVAVDVFVGIMESIMRVEDLTPETS